MKVSLLESGLDESPSKIGYDTTQFSSDALTLYPENLIHPINSGSRIGWFWLHDLKHPFWVPITEGNERRTMA